jgi:hypothetical protein
MLRVSYVYLRVPFGLLNVKSTFQSVVDCAFKDIMDKVIVIYQDDLIVFSKEMKAHVHHLKQVFERYRKYEISLNLKKSICGVFERK